MKPMNFYILKLEWSESPFHQGTFGVCLSYHPNSKRWALSARRNPSCLRLSWKIGHSEEDPKAVAIELLRKSYARGALEFDLISDNGPFQISIKDFVPQETKTSSTLTKPKASKEASALGRSLRLGRARPSSLQISQAAMKASLARGDYVLASSAGSSKKPSTKLYLEQSGE